MPPIVAWFPKPVPTPDTPKVHGDSRHNEAYHGDSLDRSRKDSSAEKEETDAAEYDWGCDPCLVWALKLGFSNAEDNEAKNSAKVERVSSNAVKGKERGEFADDAVASSDEAIED